MMTFIISEKNVMKKLENIRRSSTDCSAFLFSLLRKEASSEKVMFLSPLKVYLNEPSANLLSKQVSPFRAV